MWCFPVLFVLSSFIGASRSQCTELVSVEGYALVGHAVSSILAPSLQECMWECSGIKWCRSLTYNYANQSCDLNNVTKQMHPGDYVAKEGFAYWGGFNFVSTTYTPSDNNLFIFNLADLHLTQSFYLCRPTLHLPVSLLSFLLHSNFFFSLTHVQTSRMNIQTPIVAPTRYC